jgi:carboxylesterase type B
VQDAWGRFGRAGNPDGPGLRWPRYTAAGDENVVLDLVSSTAAHVKSDECDFWDHFQRVPR